MQRFVEDQQRQHFSSVASSVAAVGAFLDQTQLAKRGKKADLGERENGRHKAIADGEPGGSDSQVGVNPVGLEYTWPCILSCRRSSSQARQ